MSARVLVRITCDAPRPMPCHASADVPATLSLAHGAVSGRVNAVTCAPSSRAPRRERS